MKASELIDHVAAAAGIEKSQAKKVVKAVFAAITEAAKFKVMDSPVRQGRNLVTGQTIEIAASRKLTFAPAKQVKDALAG